MSDGKFGYCFITVFYVTCYSSNQPLQRAVPLDRLAININSLEDGSKGFIMSLSKEKPSGL